MFSCFFFIFYVFHLFLFGGVGADVDADASAVADDVVVVRRKCGWAPLGMWVGTIWK